MFIEEFNKIVISLNGRTLPSENATLRNTRLEPYALTVLFYKLNKLYPVFPYSTAIQLMEDNPTIETITEMAPNEILQTA